MSTELSMFRWQLLGLGRVTRLLSIRNGCVKWFVTGSAPPSYCSEQYEGRADVYKVTEDDLLNTAWTLPPPSCSFCKLRMPDTP